MGEEDKSKTVIAEDGIEDTWWWRCDRCNHRIVGVPGGCSDRPENPPHALYCKRCSSDFGFHPEYCPKYR